MRLNLGCGHDRIEGYHNVDIIPDGGADEIVDLEALPWPWPDNAAQEVLLKHVLEHLGRQPEVYLGIIKELWRVCRPGASVRVIVPHPRHDHYLNDPTHVRPITPQGLELFSVRRNREWLAKGFGNTPLGLQTGVDFELVSVNLVPDEIWRRRLESGEIGEAELAQAARQLNNVIAESQIVLRAIKVDG